MRALEVVGCVEGVPLVQKSASLAGVIGPAPGGLGRTQEAGGEEQ